MKIVKKPDRLLNELPMEIYGGAGCTSSCARRQRFANSEKLQ